jgi:hypothetical protein
MLNRIEPLRGGRDTEIDMIEREMEGGVVVIQPLEVREDLSEQGEMRIIPSGEPTTSDRRRRGLC